MLSFEVPAYRIAPGPDSHPGDSAWTPLHRARRVLRQPLERVLEDHGDWNSRSASGLRGTRSNAQRPRHRRMGRPCRRNPLRQPGLSDRKGRHPQQLSRVLSNLSERAPCLFQRFDGRRSLPEARGPYADRGPAHNSRAHLAVDEWRPCKADSGTEGGAVVDPLDAPVR